MRIKGNFFMAHKMGVESQKSITLTIISELKYANPMWMQSKKPHCELMLSDDVVGDVMDELMRGGFGQISIHHNYGTIFMSFGHSTPDVDFSTSSTQRASILNDHCRWNKGFLVHDKVHHDFQMWESRGGEGRQRRV
jgi:hypothetical protein